MIDRDRSRDLAIRQGAIQGHTDAAPSDARPAPTPPPQNGNGSFSLARQLGLGVTRIVIDPGMAGMTRVDAATGSLRRRSCSTWRCGSSSC